MKKQHFGILFCAAVLYGLILLAGYLSDSNSISIWALPFGIGYLVGGWTVCGTHPSTGRTIE